MKLTAAQAIENVGNGIPPINEMDVGLLRRGDGKLWVVGLGGSAGGISAVQEFFAAMPVNSGMAFVVVLHLSPHHESILPEMLQRYTKMSVVMASDGIQVEQNAVYVIPPNKFLASVDGHLSLIDAQEPYGKRVAVDYFLRSLAETHGTKAVAVVLSGMGADGSLGLKRIKELGGLTIAQDPDEAQHSDMPSSAIATGVVDWVLGVKEMPEKLLAYVKQRGELRLPGEVGPHPAEAMELSLDQEEEALRDVLAFLNTRTGRDFSYYKRATILRRISRRMQVNGLADLPSYLAYMRTHAGEAGALLQDLLISVTNFFRDPSSFIALERTIPELFKGKGAGDSVRVWVAGCATGEEAYSIAILLCEHAATLVGPPQLQVFATDLDEDVIREAREGFYPETISGDVSEERLQHFFVHEPGGYRVRRSVRELVLFAPHDLLKDSPFSRLDLVSCRNLLIYLKREAQVRAFDIFHFALRPAGRLFLGTSESVDEGSPLFAVLDKKHRLYTQQKGLGPQRLLGVPVGTSTLTRALAMQERTRERPAVPAALTVKNDYSLLDQTISLDSGLPIAEIHYRLIERFSPPSILVNSTHDIVHLSESAGRFLQFTGGAPTHNLLHTVHPMLRVELRAALYAAAQTYTVATAFRVPVEIANVTSMVDIRVTPAGDLAPNYLLVVFEEHPIDPTAAVAVLGNADADQAALHLERELLATKAHLRDTIEESRASNEELKASNEELQAMNEELRSATEELETSREELQSINEELTTVNEQLKTNVDQLARSNNDLQNLMAATDIATVFLDRDLRIQRFTPSAKTLFNFISTDLGRPLSDLSHKLDYPEFVEDAERSLALLQPAQREVRAEEKWYIARTLPYRTDNDHIAGVVLSFLDITEQKRAAASLKESEQRFRLVADAAPVLIWISGTDKQSSWFNQPWLAFTGKSMAQEVDNGWADGIHPDDFDRCFQEYTASFDARLPFSREYRLRRHDGKFRWLIDNGVPRFRSSGEFDGYIGSCIDVTEYKIAEADLQETARQKDEFLATLAHELRNPLAPIRSGLQLIQKVGAEGTIEKVGLMMERQLRQMTRLIDDLLDVSRLATGKLELRMERVQLQDIISAAVETTQPLINQKDHKLTIILPDNPVFVKGDPVRLSQVLSNLLDNSAKYMHRNGHIRVSVSSDSATAVLAVADDGIGIPSHMLATVFGMFTQVDQTLEKKNGGLGIGLALVKRLVQMHGGTVTAYSRGDARGAEFTVRLPIATDTTNESESNNVEVTLVGPASPMRILIVDDNEDAADTLGQLLALMGNEVLTSYDGESGINKGRAFRPRVVLCDIGMPKMNGYDTARRIRQEEWGRKTVLVALTGLSEAKDLQKSADAGFDHHLVKPVDVDALIDLLTRI